MRFKRLPATVFLAIALVGTQCACVIDGDRERGTFERTLSVTAPVRLEVRTGSGTIDVHRGGAGTVHIVGEFRVGAWPWSDARERARSLRDNPPIEQRENLILVGSNMGRELLRNIHISYQITVPEDTEVSSTAASGQQTIRDVKGPVRITSASGGVTVEKIATDVSISAASGDLVVREVGGHLRTASASGSQTLEDVGREVRARAASGSLTIRNPGGRVEAANASGHIEIRGAKEDVRARNASGGITVEGKPGGGAFWEISSASGGIRLRLADPVDAEVALETRSGSIDSDFPITIQSKSRREVRGSIGKPNARIEASTLSGSIHLLR
jgi:hypothetical protein